MKSCIFCQIVAGALPAHTVLEDSEHLAFLDRAPLFKGHVLLIPKRHQETLVEVPADAIGPLFLRAQELARAVQAALEAEGTFVAMNNKVSQSVPHLHVHVVPRKKKDGLRGFFWPRTKYTSDAEMADFAAKISRTLHSDRR